MPTSNNLQKSSTSNTFLLEQNHSDLFRVERKDEDEPQYLKTEEYEEDDYQRLEDCQDDQIQLDLSGDEESESDDAEDLLGINQ